MASYGTGRYAFEAIRRAGGRAILSYPIAHNRYQAKLYAEEAERAPEFAAALPRIDLLPAEYSDRLERECDLADRIIGNRYGYKRPAGGFFLWLDVSAQGGDEAVTKRLWQVGGLRVIPGHYLARDGADGRNPGVGYIRIALVHDENTTKEALQRLVQVLG